MLNITINNNSNNSSEGILISPIILQIGMLYYLYYIPYLSPQLQFIQQGNLQQYPTYYLSQPPSYTIYPRAGGSNIRDLYYNIRSSSLLAPPTSKLDKELINDFIRQFIRQNYIGASFKDIQKALIAVKRKLVNEEYIVLKIRDLPTKFFVKYGLNELQAQKLKTSIKAFLKEEATLATLKEKGIEVYESSEGSLESEEHYKDIPTISYFIEGQLPFPNIQLATNISIDSIFYTIGILPLLSYKSLQSNPPFEDLGSLTILEAIQEGSSTTLEAK